MAFTKFKKVAAVAVAASLAFAGSAVAPASAAKFGVVRIAIGSAPTSLNPNTSPTNLVVNSDITYLTSTGFNYFDNTPKLVKNTKFGSYKVISQKPFTVQYTVNKGLKWSDGTAIDAVDLLVPYVTSSGFFDDATSKTEFKAADKGKGLNLISKTPVLSNGNLTIKLVYDKGFYSDWEQFYDLGLPAHGLTKLAFPTLSNAAAKAKFLTAVKSKDFSVLKPIADEFNASYNILNTTGVNSSTDKDLLISSGAYRVTSAVAGKSVTLTANANYKAGPAASIDKVQFKVLDSSTWAQALENGDIDVFSGSQSVDQVKALKAISGVTVLSAPIAKYEHVDLRVDSSSPWAGYSAKAKELRKAFLLTVPRETIIANLVKPLWSSVKALSSVSRLPGQSGYAETAAVNGSKAYTVAEATRVASAKATLTKYGFTTESPLEVNLVFSANDDLRLQEAKLIQNSAAKAGFKVTLSPTTTLGAARSNKTYDAHLYSWSRSDLGVTWAQKVFGYNAPLSEARANNVIGYNNSALNTLVDKLETNLSVSNLTKQTIAIEKVLYADAVQLPIYQHPLIIASSSALKGLKVGQLAPNLVWNYWQWK